MARPKASTSKTSSRKKKRSSSSDSDSSSDRGATGKAKFEDFDVSEAIKDVSLPGAPAPMMATEPLAAGNSAVEGVAAAPHMSPPPEGVVAQPVGDEEFVPMAALQAVNVDRASEASFGLLREPGPPSKKERVTKDGEGAPAMPTALMQLLSA